MAFNNPVEAVIHEASLIWPDVQKKIECIVSIGTGMQGPQNFGEDLVDIVETLKVVSTETQKTHYLKWLPFADPSKFQEEARRYRKTENSGDWFIGDQFHEWESGPSSLLWLRARSGSGKTVLASTIIDILEHTIDKDGTEVVTYFYISFQHKDAQNIRTIKTSLLIQILRKMAPLRANGSNVYIPAYFRGLRDRRSPTTPTIEEIDSSLLRALNSSKNSYVVIDALDECEDTGLRHEIIEFLSGLVHKARSIVRVLITSRPEPDIATSMADLTIPKKFSSFDTDGVNRNIRDHLATAMEKPPYVRWAQDVRDEVIEGIASRADGIFLWADLQIRDLAKYSRKPDIRRALERLPKDLNQTYERILLAIDHFYIQEVMSVLKWLTSSFSPLRVADLADIAAFRLHMDDEHSPTPSVRSSTVSFDSDYRFDDPAEMLRILSGLVTVMNKSNDQTDGLDGVVTFAHSSVSQYLQSDEVRPPKFQIVPSDASWYVFETSLAYITHYDNLTICDNSYRNLGRACSHFYRYGKELSELSKDSATRVLSLIEPHFENMGFCLAIALHFRYFGPYSARRIVATGDTKLMKLLINSHPKQPCRCFYGTTLQHVAIEVSTIQEHFPLKGELETMMVFSQSIDYLVGTGMRRVTATESKRLEMVELLLSKFDFNINHRNETGDTVLVLAARLHYIDIVQLLLNVEEIDVNATDKRGWGILVLAITLNDPILFEVALGCKGIDRELLDVYGWTPLEWSVYHGRKPMTRALQTLIDPTGGKHSVTKPGLLCFAQIRELNPSMNEVWFVAFSHDGSQLAVCGNSEEAEIWSVGSGELLYILPGHNVEILHLAWSPDDTRLVTCSSDNYARMFQIETNTTAGPKRLEPKTIIVSEPFGEFYGECRACAWIDNQSLSLASYDLGKCLVKVPSDPLQNGGFEVLDTERQYVGIAMAPNGERLYALARSPICAIIAFDVHTGSKKHITNIPDYGCSIEMVR
ncbi:hypothetical protein F4808DRAFT_231038 [Astrocystis sublimbata]|nr:hypothetical protein F4808DRAFT_231038 [Astrocystis sublimbata]